MNASALKVKLRVIGQAQVRKTCAIFFNQSICNHKANIMTSIRVFGADVSQANDKVFHGDKGKRFEGESKSRLIVTKKAPKREP